jgi:hypothetical protein
MSDGDGQLLEYRSGAAFPGVVGRTFDESSQAWPEPLRAADGAPNVLFIVLDDTGFGQVGCYASPIRTPNIDRLAAGGVLHSNMQTAALCSPTRSCIPTGRNHHSNHMAGITEISTGFPGYDGCIPFEHGFLSPYRFTGTIHRVVYDVTGAHVVDHAAEIRQALARQ